MSLCQTDLVACKAPHWCCAGGHSCPSPDMHPSHMLTWRPSQDKMVTVPKRTVTGTETHSGEECSNRQAEMKILTELVLLLWPAQEQQPQVQPQAWPLHLPLVGVYAPYPAASHTPHSSFASWWLRRFWSADGKSDPGWFGAGTA